MFNLVMSEGGTLIGINNGYEFHVLFDENLADLMARFDIDTISINKYLVIDLSAWESFLDQL